METITLEQVYYIGQTVGVIVVIASLMFVGIQVMQNTRAIRSATAQAVNDNHSTFYNELAHNPNVVGLMLKGLTGLSTLEQTEKAQFIALLTSHLGHFQNAYYQWQNGALLPALWHGWENLFMNLLFTPGGWEVWKLRSYIFGEEFREHVETDLIKRTPPAEAKAFGTIPLRQPPHA